MAALAELGLPFILQWLDDRLPGRGVAYALLLLLLSNTLQFFGDTIFQPLLAAPPERGSGVWFYTWYMQPIAAGSSFEGGSPSGAIQFCVLTALLGLGVWELTHAFSIARKDASG